MKPLRSNPVGNVVARCASGKFIASMDAKDLLPEHTPYLMAKELIEHPGADRVFSDEDGIDDAGRRSEPCFKPDWNPALMFSQNAFGRLGVFRKSWWRRSAVCVACCYELSLRCARASAGAGRRQIQHRR
jgi:hypothetical protein